MTQAVMVVLAAAVAAWILAPLRGHADLPVSQDDEHVMIHEGPGDVGGPAGGEG